MSYAPDGSKLMLPDGEMSRDRRTISLKAKVSKRREFGRIGSFRRSRATKRRAMTYPIIVHSHLCWDWVWQRPQQFLSRLSARHRVLFVETLGPDSQLSSPMARFHGAEQFPNVTVLQIQFPAWRWSDGAYVDAERRRLVKEFLGGPGAGQFEDPVQWFYDPMAFPSFAGQMGEIVTVYDCMDELSKFRYAPPDIVAREAALLANADVVFTGGRTLWEMKRRANSNCHFYGCGVDATHFGRARSPKTKIPADLASFKKPVLGFVGVVDERMDYDLLARLADANPCWSIVVLGPIVKVELASLPRRANIHWLGARPYTHLPAYCSGFDVCLMPFALNEATEFINPTKALEYMATGRPVISSAVKDVVRNFGSVIQIANGHQEFISLCREGVEAPDAGAIKRGLQMAAENSWERIVVKLEEHIEAAILNKQTAAVIA